MVWGSGDFHEMGRQKVALAQQLAGFETPVVICDVDTVGTAQGFAGGTFFGGSWQAFLFSWPTCLYMTYEHMGSCSGVC